MMLMMARVLLVGFCVCFALVGAASVNSNDADQKMHLYPAKREARKAKNTRYTDEENEANYWNTAAQQVIYEKITETYNNNVAKNVIMFLGDGMSIPTLAATRAYIGQKRNETGEEVNLSFELFPFTALSKTYCVDRQVADSACSATAYLCGVKANEGTIGVTGQVPLGQCEPSTNENTHVYSIAKWFQEKGRSTGLVTTTRVTHASPAGVYAHIAHRDWESDTDVMDAGADVEACPDIAYQLVYGETGKNLKVALGGGRGMFLPKNVTDEEGSPGSRTDEENLIESWLASKVNATAKYVWNRSELLQVSEDTEYLLGLFESSHCQYHLDSVDSETEPTLAEMTEAAIKLLSRDDNGYFLFVEGGRIDHAHHSTYATKALDETEQFSEAIQKAIDITSRSDTLVVVTSDHAHTMSISGYPDRGNPILGVGGTAKDKLPYATLSYANGPSYDLHIIDGARAALNQTEMLTDKNYMYPATAPLSSETHGGDDVGIFAIGPHAHLFTGVLEQNVIPHLMAYASCVGDGYTACAKVGSSSSGLTANLLATIIIALIPLFVLRRH